MSDKKKDVREEIKEETEEKHPIGFFAKVSNAIRKHPVISGFGGGVIVIGGGGYGIYSAVAPSDTEEPPTSIVAEVETENTEEAMKALIENMITTSEGNRETTEAVTEEIEDDSGGEEATTEADPGGKFTADASNGQAPGSPGGFVPTNANQNSTGKNGSSGENGGQAPGSSSATVTSSNGKDTGNKSSTSAETKPKEDNKPAGSTGGTSSTGSSTAPSGNQQGGGNNNNSSQTATSPSTSTGGTTNTDTGGGNNTATTEPPKPVKEEPTTQAHQHSWVDKYETVHHEAVYEDYTIPAYDEDVWVAEHCFCKKCGLDLTEAFGTVDCIEAATHVNDCGWGYKTGDVYETVHHEAESGKKLVKEAYDEKKFVDQVCTGCGMTYDEYYYSEYGVHLYD